MSRLPSSTLFQREAFDVYGVLKTGTYQAKSFQEEEEDQAMIEGLMSRSTVHGKRQCLKKLVYKALAPYSIYQRGLGFTFDTFLSSQLGSRFGR